MIKQNVVEPRRTPTAERGTDDQIEKTASSFQVPTTPTKKPRREIR